MSREFWVGLAVVPAIALAVVGSWSLLLAAATLIGWVWPPHWSPRGPQRRAVNASTLFRRVNAVGRHMATFRRLVAVGPWTVYIGRYRPGWAEEHARDPARII